MKPSGVLLIYLEAELCIETLEPLAGVVSADLLIDQDWFGTMVSGSVVTGSVVTLNEGAA
jgi:hypothetical protein